MRMTALASFTVSVEAGRLPLSMLIAILAMVWLLERVW